MVTIGIVNSSSFGRIFPSHDRALRRLGKLRRVQVSPFIDGKSLAKKLRGCSYIVASVNPQFGADFFKALGPGLKLLARHGIGTNNVDLKAATAHGVIVTKVQGIVEREAMAEHAIALLLTSLRRLHPAQDAVKAGGWMRRPEFVGAEIKGRTLGIVGIGNIGTRVAAIAGRGFEARVIACDPYLSAATIRKRGAVPVSLDRLLRQSDMVSLNCSLNPANLHMMGTREFSRMKAGAILVNTARGELVQLKPLLKALKRGPLAGYAADVVEGEPVTHRQHPLLKEPKSLIVPHIGAYTRESLEKMGAKMVQDLIRVSKGQRPDELANPEIFAKLRKR